MVTLASTLTIKYGGVSVKADTKKLAIADAKAEADAKQAQQPADEQAKLLSELEQAKLDGDWKLLAVKAKALADYQTKLEALEHEAIQNELMDVANELKASFVATINKAVVDGKLDTAELVSFSWDMTSPLNTLTVSLLKAKATSRKASSTGYGKKFIETTESLLETHGHESFKDGLTFKEAWDAKADKNSRYAVRKKLTNLYGTPTS